jgi:tetratricopeptide (TPR) repeat protein
MVQIPYALLRDIFSSSFGIQDHDSAAVAREKLEHGILSYIGNEENATLYAHFTGHLIGLDYSTSPHLQGILGDAQQIRDRAFHYVAQFLIDITREQIAIIFLEDIHWADQGSLDFFHHLMNTQPDLPLLIIGLTRAILFEARPDWGAAPVHSLRLDLLPLSEENCRRLVEEILQKVPEVPSALTDLIVAKAEGSPFYVEELIKVLIEKGIIQRGQDQWKVEMDQLSDLSVPATLTGLLQARLDNLNPSMRETLQQASVVGRIFWTSVVERMKNPEKPNIEISTPIDDRLRPLRAREFIFEYGDLTTSQFPEFIFKSAILHDVTYESVLLRLRRAYHLQAAEGLIGIWGERINEYAGRVGEHYEHAGELLKAAEWYARAGTQAQATYEPNAAIHYYQKALDFLRSSVTPDLIFLQLEIYGHLGEVLNWRARYTEAAETYNAMLQLAQEHQDEIAQSRAWQGLATSLSYRGHHDTALESAIQAGSLAQNANARLELAKAIWTQGYIRYRLGEQRTALSLGEQALKIATELDNSNEMARSLNLLGAAHYVLGRYTQAQKYWESALNIFQEQNNRQQGMDLLSNLGVIADAQGDYETAFQRYHSALEIAREIGYRDGEIVFLTNRGSEQVALGNYGAGEADLRRAMQPAGVTGSWCLPITYNYHAEALLGLGRYKEALHSAKQALVLGEEDKTPEYIGLAWRTLGMVSERLGKPLRLRDRETRKFINYDAETCFLKSEKIFTEAEIQMERARTLREWAKFTFRMGDRERAEKLSNESREIFARLGADREVQRMAHPPA